MDDALFAVVYLGGLGFAGGVLAVAAGRAVLQIIGLCAGLIVAGCLALTVLSITGGGEDGSVFAGLFLVTNFVGLAVGATAGALLRALRGPGSPSP